MMKIDPYESPKMTICDVSGDATDKLRWSRRYFAALGLAIIFIPFAVYAVVNMTAAAIGAYSEWGIDEKFLPTITRFCAWLGPLGLAVVGATVLLAMAAVAGWRKTFKATLISAIAFSTCVVFYIAAFFAACLAMIVDISSAK